MSDEKELKDLFEDDATKPDSPWFAFENVGDTISGELIEAFDSTSKFGEQRVYVIRKEDGQEINVGLKATTHRLNIQQLKRAEVGDTIGIRFASLVDTGKINKAKSLEVRIRHKIAGEIKKENF